MTKDRNASLVEPVMIELKLSWVDRALRVVERLPAHPVAVYSILALLGALVLQGVFWGCGVMPWGVVSVQVLTTGCWSVLSLAGIHLSFAVAGRSLNTFRPLPTGGEQGFGRALQALATVPAWSSVLAGAFGILFLWECRLPTRRFSASPDEAPARIRLSLPSVG